MLWPYRRFFRLLALPCVSCVTSAVAHYADFLSLGTNDLTQYTMVAGRENSLVSHYFMDDHPAVMRLVEMVVCARLPRRRPASAANRPAARRSSPNSCGWGCGPSAWPRRAK